MASFYTVVMKNYQILDPVHLTRTIKYPTCINLISHESPGLSYLVFLKAEQQVSAFLTLGRCPSIADVDLYIRQHRASNLNRFTAVAYKTSINTLNAPTQYICLRLAPEGMWNVNSLLFDGRVKMGKWREVRFL